MRNELLKGFTLIFGNSEERHTSQKITQLRNILRFTNLN